MSRLTHSAALRVDMYDQLVSAERVEDFFIHCIKQILDDKGIRVILDSKVRCFVLDFRDEDIIELIYKEKSKREDDSFNLCDELEMYYNLSKQRQLVYLIIKIETVPSTHFYDFEFKYPTYG